MILINEESQELHLNGIPLNSDKNIDIQFIFQSEICCVQNVLLVAGVYHKCQSLPVRT